MKYISYLIAVILFFGVAEAKAESVDLELVLAVDVSRSVDATEAKLQRDGYIAALRDPRVHAAIKSGFNRKIAVLYLEWAGYGNTHIAVNWSSIANLDDANKFIAQLIKAEPVSASRTSISGAIESAIPLFDNNGYEGERRVIDISGDGPNNTGPLVTVARDAALKRGITINGLPILDDKPSFGYPAIVNLDLYYENCVIGGNGAFVVVAENFTAFGEAILRKLILEIAARPMQGHPSSHVLYGQRLPRMLIADKRTPPPCDIGELQWRRMVQ
ncbi:MAG: DUF1194 domain-containing protein [Alphaproteobacteria bacterium]